MTPARTHASSTLVALLLVLAGITVLAWPSRPDVPNTVGPILASVRATGLVVWALLMGLRTQQDTRWNLAQLTVAGLVTAPFEVAALWAGHAGLMALWSAPYAVLLTVSAFGLAALATSVARRRGMPQARFVVLAALVAILVVLDAAVGPPFWLPWVATMTPSWPAGILTGLMASLSVGFILHVPDSSGVGS